MSEGIDWAKILAGIVSGGPAYWIAGGVALALGVILYFWWKKVQRDLADQASREVGEKEIAGTVPANDEPSKNWEEARKKSDEKREAARKKLASDKEK